jgi:hypothetical protein
MFGRSRPVVFDPYRSRRSRARPPAWLVSAVLGIAIGAGGLYFVQERYLPQRLTPEQSARLKTMLEKTERERARLGDELADTSAKLAAGASASKTLSEELAAARKTVAQQRADIASLLEALPPDPRGGTIAVRAARFETEGGHLVYQLVLSREKTGRPFKGQMQFIVSGVRGGAPSSVTLDAGGVSFNDYDSLSGRLALPDGFTPSQATVNVLDGPGGKVLGMRVLYVK